MLHLYSYFYSSAAFRVRIALNLKALEWDTIPVNLLGREHKSEAYLTKNPQGLVPALDTGEVVLNQSLAIIEYLEETFPQHSLLPNDPLAKAQVRALAYQVAMDIHPVNNLRVVQHITGPLGHSDDDKKAWFHHWMSTGFAALEKSLALQATSIEDKSRPRFCFGDTPTLADVCLIPQVVNAHRMKCPMDDYPIINSIFDNCMAMKAFDLAQPKNQPDSTL